MRPRATLLAVFVLGGPPSFAGEPAVLRFTYATRAAAGPHAALYAGGALSVEMSVYRTEELVQGAGPFFAYQRYESGSDPVYSFTGAVNAGIDSITFAYKPGAGACCAQVGAAATLPLRTWTHLAATLDGTTALLYLGGAEISSQPSAGMPPVAVLGTLDVGNLFPGAIRDVRIWSRALSAAEVAAAAGGTRPDATGLVADWQLDDGSGQQPADVGTNGIPFVLGSSPTVDFDDPLWVPEAFLAEGPYFDLQRELYASPIEAWFEPMAADPNRDGFLDLFYVGGLPCAVMTCTEPYYSGDPPAQLPPLRSNGDGTFTQDSTLVDYEQVAGGFRYVPGEFTGDAYPDIFVVDSGPEPYYCGIDCGPPGIDASDFPGGRPRLFVGHPDGKLVEESAARMPDLLAFVHAGSAGDVDGDGDRDIYLQVNDDHNLADCQSANFYAGVKCPKLLLNDGTGHFVENHDRIPLSVSTRLDEEGNSVHYQCTTMLDADGDGDVDIYLGGPGGANVEYADVILVNDGTGHFARAPAGTMPNRPGGVADGGSNTLAADLNRDGVAEIITTQSYRLALYWANGDGTFRAGPPEIHGAPYPSYDLCHPADLNADGWPDLACLGGNVPRFFYNLGNESFALMPFDYDFGPTFKGGVGLVDDDALLDVLVGSGGEHQFLRQVKPYFPPNAVGIFANGFEPAERSLWTWN